MFPSNFLCRSGRRGLRTAVEFQDNYSILDIVILAPLEGIGVQGFRKGGHNSITNNGRHWNKDNVAWRCQRKAKREVRMGLHFLKLRLSTQVLDRNLCYSIRTKPAELSSSSCKCSGHVTFRMRCRNHPPLWRPSKSNQNTRAQDG